MAEACSMLSVDASMKAPLLVLSGLCVARVANYAEAWGASPHFIPFIPFLRGRRRQNLAQRGALESGLDN